MRLLCREEYKERILLYARLPRKVTIARSGAGYAALEHVNDTVYNASIVFPRRACLVRWQMRLYPSHCLSMSQNSPLRIEVPHAESTRCEGIRTR